MRVGGGVERVFSVQGCHAMEIRPGWFSATNLPASTSPPNYYSHVFSLNHADSGEEAQVRARRSNDRSLKHDGVWTEQSSRHAFTLRQVSDRVSGWAGPQLVC